MAEMADRYKPDYAIHPGEYLEEILESREIKKRDFAERIGLSVKAVSQIINGKSLYSPEVALMLEKTLEVDAKIWMDLADRFQLAEAKDRERERLETEKAKEWVRGFPTAELKRMGILLNTRASEILADGILRFFNVSSPEVWDDYIGKKAVAYRKCCVFKESREATAVWLRLAEREAEKIDTGKFDRESFKEQLQSIRGLTRENHQEFYPEMVERCRKTGVALVLVPELKDTHLSGAACWISQYKAMIAVSLRYKTNDHFWFTFFHEAAHILFHGKKNIYLDVKKEGGSSEEEEADRFSRELLIPEKEYRAFIESGLFPPESIEKFASEIRIHPGIVVGRLQHDGLIDFSRCNHLKAKYIILD